METPQTDVKPKRQLTEAQRLAFMKGREKRLANLAKKREEKLESERANSENSNMEVPAPTPIKQEEVVHAKSEDVVRGQDDEWAVKVADMVYNRIKSAPPDPKPKRKYVRKIKPEVIAPPQVEEESQEEEEEGYKLFAPVPQKSYCWM